MKQVRKGFLLTWPRVWGGDIVRGTVGYVVDDEHPLEREWLTRQEHKLEAAPKGAKPGKIRHPKALAALDEYEGKEEPEPTPKPASVARKRAGKAAASQHEIPVPDEPAKAMEQ